MVNRNKQKRRDIILKSFLLVVFIIELLFVVTYSGWNQGVFLFNFCFGVPIIVGFYIFIPRKCVNCKIYMKREISPQKSIVYLCEKCNNSLDTEIGLTDSANS